MVETLISYPDELLIKPFRQPARGSLRLPGSKSITNRALILAALSDTPCRIDHPLLSEDTAVMIAALRRLGVAVEDHESSLRVSRPAHPTLLPAGQAELFVGNSGTSMRFLTALVSLARGRFRLDGVPRMRERPIEDLLSALRQLGVSARSELDNGCPPVVVWADGLPGGSVNIKGDVSSQFLSGLLMAAPLARAPVTLTVEGPLVSRPYVDMTLAMIHTFGAEIEEPAPGIFCIPPLQHYQAPNVYTVEPDASAASYFLAAAAVTGGEVRLEGLTRESLQGDIRLADLLEQMGCRVDWGGALTLRGGPLRGLDVDMNDISDTVMTLGAVACFADGPTTIRNVAHIRHKETDRLAALATELRRLGAGVEETSDSLTIRPGPLHGAAVETYQDHRMAMSLAGVGRRVPGVVIRNPGCVAKTYPNFFADLEKLRGA